MIHKAAVKFIMCYLSRQYKRTEAELYFISGTGKHYPMYLLYTENADIRAQLEQI